VPTKATRSQHYLNIAEFYGRMLVEDMKDPRIPDFVLAHSARKTAHFALVGLRLAERRRVCHHSGSEFQPVSGNDSRSGLAAISPASLS
jgi:hypothetical protein